MQLLFEKSVNGRTGVSLPVSDVDEAKKPDAKYLRDKNAELPELSELDIVRHFTLLSKKNFGIDSHFYPLGSCTMKYNPKILESVSAMNGFKNLHPLLPQLDTGQHLTDGALEVIFNLQEFLCEITGMKEFTTQPLAGAHGELTGIMLISAYHRDKGNKKKFVIVPDSSHGTNPASAAIAGYDIITIPSDSQGVMDLQKFSEALNEDVAAVMLTCPNTLGIFNSDIKAICDKAHAHDALVYYDGANLNAILGKVRPGDVGFDVVHINTHKTFATPHGGGGPGAGPVGVNEKLAPYLPIPFVKKNKVGKLILDWEAPKSIGHIASFYGNYGILLRAYAYLLLLGKNGLINATEKAVLNANYIMHKLKDHFHLPFQRTCMHECVFTAQNQIEHGIHATDIAKYLLDKGHHAPTVYFPLNVKEAIMIEPTETESKDTIDRFIEDMIETSQMAKKNPQALKDAPQTMPVSRLDETKAARDINVRWTK